MPVTDYFTIVNLTMPSSWIALIIAFVFAYIAVRLRFGKKEAEYLSDAFFYLLITWKVSVILVDFTTVIQSPLTILYFHGGVFGFYLGLVVVCVKFLVDKRKMKLRENTIFALFTGVVLTQSVYQVAMVILNDGDLIARIITCVGFIGYAAFFWFTSVKSIKWQVQHIVFFIAVHGFIASMQSISYLSTPLVTSISVSVFVGFVYFANSRKELNWRNNNE